MEILITYGLPLLIANVVHHAIVIPRNLFPSLAIPIDVGTRFAGAPLFGTKKTVRGLLTVAFLTALLAPHFALLFAGDSGRFLLSGLIVGCAYMLGELPNSFLKRRIGINEGVSETGSRGSVFMVIDHTDSVLAATLAIYFLEGASSEHLFAFFFVGTVAHVCVNILIRRFRKTTTP